MAQDPYDQFVPLLAQYAASDRTDPRREQLHEELLTGFLPVAQHVARRFAGRGQPIEDLEQVATIGLLGALKRFDPGRGRDFLSFAVPTIMGEVRRHFRDSAWVVRTPRGVKERYLAVTAATTRLGNQLNRSPTVSEIAADLELSCDEVADAVAAGGSLQPSSLDQTLTEGGDDALADVLGDADPGLERAEARAMVHDLVASLPSRERTILVLRFVHDRTQSEIGEAVGISQMHVSRLLARTLGQLREHITAELDGDPADRDVEPVRRAARVTSGPSSTCPDRVTG